jgi:thioredoxin reductase (NADPH)
VLADQRIGTRDPIDPPGTQRSDREEGSGEFVAEIGQLSGQPAFVEVHAVDDVESLLIAPQSLRALMIEEPELGERIMQSLILRCVALIEAGAGGPVLIGPASSPDVVRLQGFLARNAYPHQLLDRHTTRTQRSSSSNMLPIQRTCRLRCVQEARF